LPLELKGWTKTDRAAPAKEMLQLVQLPEFADHYPWQLSGGMRQRIAIARALLLDPRILILDDATASVDATTESRIRLALEEVMRGRTTLIIAHRLSTIALADRIVVLEDGRIVADGSHEELIGSSAVYREIHDHGLVERRFVDADGDHVLMPVDHEEASA